MIFFKGGFGQTEDRTDNDWRRGDSGGGPPPRQDDRRGGGGYDDRRFVCSFFVSYC